jgi:hypothetical protein
MGSGRDLLVAPPRAARPSRVENLLQPVHQKLNRDRMNDRFVYTTMDEPAQEEQDMLVVRRRVAALFVDRSNRHWIVQDPEGNFWLLPSMENPWDHRQPFQPADEADLEWVPGHYKCMLGLPF